MGVVYAAYDPELNRKVALKLLAPREGRGGATGAAGAGGAGDGAGCRTRTWSAVHDVGTLRATRVFMAMEFVEGGRPWRSGCAERRAWSRGVLAGADRRRGRGWRRRTGPGWSTGTSSPPT